ncbi:hypothetical protein LTR57_011384 [Friedmanniomyces endolithicus]|nr:hypothetical protein LTS02_008491 [Friedmanniomyces endolithicus]KAK0918790.1 hypothetical protein LTR57_011384 [Friedmanniomyces endolithicus]
MDEYENDRWRVISGKIGNGFSAAACREKAEDLALLSSGEAGTNTTVPEDVPLTARGGARQHGTRAAVAAASASALTSASASALLPSLRTTGLSQHERGETTYGLPLGKASEGA